MSGKKPAPKSIADFISLVSSIIGIFGFLTGISSIPVLLGAAGNQVQDESSTWLGSLIPSSISIPAFVIALLFVHGLYFVVVYKASKWLYLQGILKKHREATLRYERYSDLEPIFGIRAADSFSIVFFIVLGVMIGLLVVNAFFGLSYEALADYRTGPQLMFASLGMIVFVIWLCWVAKETASRD